MPEATAASGAIWISSEVDMNNFAHERSSTRFAEPKAGARAIRAGFLAAILLGLGCVLPPSVMAAKSYRAESYHSEIQVQSDGSVLVRERIRVRFHGGPFTFFYRAVPFRKTDGIEFVAASDSTKLRRRSSGLDVTWRFPACRDTARDFALEYRVVGVLQERPGGYELSWSAFPGERAYRIDAASARVILPHGAMPPLRYRVKPVGRSFHEGPGGLVLDAAPLAPERTVTLTVEFPGDAVRAGTPLWQKKSILWQKRAPAPLTLSLLLLLSGLAWYFRFRPQPDRGRRPPNGKPPEVSGPPEVIDPAIGGALRDGAVSPAHMIACLLHLAERNVVRFETQPKGAWWSRPAPLLRRLPGSPSLTSWERLALDAAFHKAKGPDFTDFNRAQAGLLRGMKNFTREVTAELVRRGDLDPAAARSRSQMYKSGALILGAALVCLVPAILLWSFLGPSALAPTGALFLLALIALIDGSTLPQWTTRGAQRAQAWRGFTRHLKEAGKKHTVLDAARFGGWVPYAIALGVGQEWVKAGKRLGLMAPAWFQSVDGSGADLSAFMVIAATSSHGAGGAGGGGAAGGGSSGAG
jgi:hypothetical protein